MNFRKKFNSKIVFELRQVYKKELEGQLKTFPNATIGVYLAAVPS